jgi:hypothetical protein
MGLWLFSDEEELHAARIIGRLKLFKIVAMLGIIFSSCVLNKS